MTYATQQLVFCVERTADERIADAIVHTSSADPEPFFGALRRYAAPLVRGATPPPATPPARDSTIQVATTPPAEAGVYQESIRIG